MKFILAIILEGFQRKAKFTNIFGEFNMPCLTKCKKCLFTSNFSSNYVYIYYFDNTFMLRLPNFRLMRVMKTSKNSFDTKMYAKKKITNCSAYSRMVF